MRPAKRLIFNVNTHKRSVRVDVLPNGNVRLEFGWRQEWGRIVKKNGFIPIKARGWVSLDGIAFSVSGAKKMALKW